LGPFFASTRAASILRQLSPSPHAGAVKAGRQAFVFSIFSLTRRRALSPLDSMRWAVANDAGPAKAADPPHATEMYKWRHLIENDFQHLKEFRHIARYPLR
jgi:hypothetical protein